LCGVGALNEPRVLATALWEPPDSLVFGGGGILSRCGGIVRGVARICIFRSDYGDAGEKKPTGCDHCLRGRGVQIGGFFAARDEKY
jgi:hypothetical protein